MYTELHQSTTDKSVSLHYLHSNRCDQHVAICHFCVIIGNPQFLNRTGSQCEEGSEPLVHEVSHQRSLRNSRAVLVLLVSMANDCCDQHCVINNSTAILFYSTTKWMAEPPVEALREPAILFSCLTQGLNRVGLLFLLFKERIVEPSFTFCVT